MDNDLRHELNPIGEPNELDDHTDIRFQPESVDRILATEDLDSKIPDMAHHYNQARSEWGGTAEVKTLLRRLDPASDELTVAVFGGFTGEFARALRGAGHEVIFTDPIAGWVDRAEADGFEAYQCSAETVPTDVLTRTDLFATFECYFPFTEPISQSLYTSLRLLTAPYGILIAESSRTRETLVERGNDIDGVHQLELFRPRLEVERRHWEVGNLRAFQYLQPNNRWPRMERCARLFQVMYDLGVDEDRTVVDKESVRRMAERTGISPQSVEMTLYELYELYRDLLGHDERKATPVRLIEICGREFDLDVIP